MSPSPVIFIVDPDPVSRAKLARMAEEMRIPSREYSSAEAFLDSFSDSVPGCLVIEFRLRGISGLELQETLKRDCITLPVIFVTAHAETSSTVRAMRNGAITVLEKPFRGQELWDAIRQALSHDQTMRRIDAKHSEVRRRLSRLTPKERRVLELMVKGKANKAIANKLDVSVRTVEARRHQIFKKTHTDSVAELVRLIVQSGFEVDE